MRTPMEIYDSLSRISDSILPRYLRAPPGVCVTGHTGPRWEIKVTGRTDLVAIIPCNGWRGWLDRLLGRERGWRVVLLPQQPPDHVNCRCTLQETSQRDSREIGSEDKEINMRHVD